MAESGSREREGPLGPPDLVHSGPFDWGEKRPLDFGALTIRPETTGLVIIRLGSTKTTG